jgi:hypothetical protein
MPMLLQKSFLFSVEQVILERKWGHFSRKKDCPWTVECAWEFPVDNSKPDMSCSKASAFIIRYSGIPSVFR